MIQEFHTAGAIYMLFIDWQCDVGYIESKNILNENHEKLNENVKVFNTFWSIELCYMFILNVPQIINPQR